MTLGHETALEEMLKLNPHGVKLVFKELLEKGKVNFPDLTDLYVKHLEAGNTQKDHLVSTLSLHLGLCAGGDKSPFAKGARRYLYTEKLYTGTDGSVFGQQLADEFGPTEK